MRWSDQDANGHVNNAKIVTLIEEARIDWFKREAAESGREIFDDPRVVVFLQVDYARSVTAAEPLEVHISTARVGRSSFTLAYEGLQASSACFTASTTLVTLDRDTGRPRPLTEGERQVLAAHAGPADDASV